MFRVTQQVKLNPYNSFSLLRSAMFVEPSYAKYLSNSGVAAALGRRPEILDTAGRLKDEKKETNTA
jgi:hypothetical protein